MSPVRRDDKTKLLLAEIDDEQFTSEDDKTARAEMEIPETQSLVDRKKVPESVAQRKPQVLQQSVSQTAMGVHVSQKTTSPGQALNHLKDRRSMSRLDSTAARQELNSTGKKNGNKTGVSGVGVVRTALNRDLSMPRLRVKEKPIDEYIPNAVPRVQIPVS